MARWEQEPTHPPAELGGSALQENAPAKYVTEGLNARTKFCPASARRGNISLDIPFYRPKGWEFETRLGSHLFPTSNSMPGWLTAEWP
jgi:hypothetical protein